MKYMNPKVDGSEIRVTSWYGKYPIIDRVLYIAGGERRISEPSTVCCEGCFESGEKSDFRQVGHTHLKTNISLKNDGWKMYFLLK